jgi:ABC-type transporter Mla maintaining outer membrane lipid asymmetry ATPase subunit MlaF
VGQPKMKAYGPHETSGGLSKRAGACRANAGIG